MSTPRRSFMSTETQPPIQDQYLHAVAGATAGMSASFVVCPLDVVKTRLQGQVHDPSGAFKYKGTLATLGRIFQEEGVQGCYRGLSPTMLGMVPTWATYFTSYNAIKGRLEATSLGRGSQQGIQGESVVHTISACGAGILTATVTNPIWVVKTRIQMTPSNECKYKGTAGAFVAIFRNEGVASFYKGLGPSLMGVSHITIQFPLYERFKKQLREAGAGSGTAEGHLGISQLVGAAAASKIVASLFTYPHEVVRTRMYIETGENVGTFASYVKLFREGGILGMYRGFGANALRVVPASAVTFVSYEIVYDQLQLWYGGKQQALEMRPSVEHKDSVIAHHK